MADLRWHKAQEVQLDPSSVNEHGYFTGPTIKVQAVAFSGPWLFVQRETGAIETVAAHLVVVVRLAEGAVPPKTL